ncbi:hypothetical protein CHS0354_019403 [Potamilus streckersoni]|uniref:DED domain-containing protein n=1 Tax=Potamilus streckersoni TaxID=2493646 RepID=A0AAE0SHL8_9BIVA|nr:hypothetical protein CHS0354_019403 [Potamilus streckersoni]
MYRMKSHRIGPYRRCCPETSPFCRMILKIAHGLNEEEVSELKLALLVDNHVTVKGQAELKNGAEVMRYLYSRKLISKKGASFLIELLKQISRVDLATLVENHFLNVALEAFTISSRQSTIDQPSGGQSIYSFSSTFPSSHPKMVSKDEDHVIHEETLPKQIHDPNALYEDTNPEKVSLKTFKKEAVMSEILPSSQSSEMSVGVDDLSFSQDSMMSISDDEKLSQIEKSTMDEHLEAC